MRNVKITQDMLAETNTLCCERYLELISAGCAEDVAADRVWDCLSAALGVVKCCYDTRDRLFERRLRDVVERGSINEEGKLGKHHREQGRFF